VKGCDIGAPFGNIKTEKRLAIQEFVAALNRRQIIDNAEAKVAQEQLLTRLG